MMTRIDPLVLDRGLGCLLGLAVGDALGTTLEFEERDSFPRHTEMIGAGPFRLKPGQWTDDTAMALALGESLSASGGLDELDLMTRFLAWRDTGQYSCTGKCFDIGGATNAALTRFSRTGNPQAGSDDETTAGNGSLMRLAPVALFALDDGEMSGHLAAAQSATTHAAPQAVEACEIFAMMLREAILGAGKDAIKPRNWDGHDEIAAVLAGSWRRKGRDEISSSGYVVDTLEAALWSVHHAQSFEEAVITAVNLGGDADTVGAVTGQIAGAIWGANAIPGRWLKPLAWRERIEALGRDLMVARDSTLRGSRLVPI
jgi:ADP-ribosyl-[dinitrogen reductase] hydrolase